MVSALSGSGTISLLNGTASLTGGANKTSLMMTRIGERMFETMRKQTDQVNAAFDARIESLSARQGTIAGRARDASRILDGVEKSEEQITEIKGYLRDLKTIVAKAVKNPSASDFYSEQFNAKITEINRAANRYSGDFNLIGRPNDLTLLPDKKTVQVSDFGGNLELQAKYAGTSFNIKGTGDSAGLFYQNKSTSNVMYKVERIGNDDSLSVVGHDQGRISNLVVGDDGSISFDVDGGASSFTGTLQKGGLEIMPSWFYGDLSDATGTDDAMTAIRKAEKLLQDASFSVTQVKIQVEPKLRRLEQDKQELLDEMSKASGEQYRKVAEIEDETRAQYNAIESSLNSQASALSGYQSILASGTSGKFVNTLG
ncbi:hypothetical protein [Roseospira navarrensis]|uniref:Flagellin n=1 Tax=Roseospira navarrensis TaxID=140058 RepID=A0A7X1ZB17_9PROT|nr:hypothetical protein [Roseospira navarrensis]MQX35261.1 hypothetical protein [Roseospira navarrensis]